jgi:hypothetical protein
MGLTGQYPVTYVPRNDVCAVFVGREPPESAEAEVVDVGGIHHIA